MNNTIACSNIGNNDFRIIDKYTCIRHSNVHSFPEESLNLLSIKKRCAWKLFWRDMVKEYVCKLPNIFRLEKRIKNSFWKGCECVVGWGCSYSREQICEWVHVILFIGTIHNISTTIRTKNCERPVSRECIN